MLEPQSNQNPDKDIAELGLSNTFVPDIPKDILFPEELNTYLRDQIHCLTHENGMLKRNLSECENQLKESLSKTDSLTKEVKKFQDASVGGSFSTVSNIASAKIVELSKKLREKCSELEVSKTRCSKLESRLKILDETPKIQEAISDKEKKSQEKINDKDKIDDVKQLQEKLSATNAKLFETKNVNAQLKNDLKLANKFLQSEIGETFENLQSLVNSGANWRGRSQMVCDLQQKNAELREKVKSLSEKSPKPEQPYIKPDKRIEAVSKENNQLKNDLQDLKRKLDASKARLKVFETENSVLKGKISVINEQQENDRNLITSLTAQLSTIRNLQNDDFKRKDQTISRLQKEIKELKSNIEKEKLRGDNLTNELNEKNEHINYLNNQKNNVSQIDLISNARNEINSINRPKSSKFDEKTLGRMEAERIRLLELTKIANERLETERKILNNLQLQLKSERQKNARLESRIACLELDKHDKNSVYSGGSGHRGKEKEENYKDKLELAEENVKVLQNRLEIEQKERQIDFNEFSKILQNYTNCN
ncbi:coiled-coil domain-containing protein 13 [Onthophagus taurus]|uniref:coiled-coil domain-containing protein 13 n=1 Tax=Onthophagus taurus TaxID=166361 RepID=UPI0039BDB8F3